MLLFLSRALYLANPRRWRWGLPLRVPLTCLCGALRKFVRLTCGGGARGWRCVPLLFFFKFNYKAIAPAAAPPPPRRRPTFHHPRTAAAAAAVNRRSPRAVSRCLSHRRCRRRPRAHVRAHVRAQHPQAH